MVNIREESERIKEIIYDLEETHLIRKGHVGHGEEFKTLMDYCLIKVPSLNLK